MAWAELGLGKALSMTVYICERIHKRRVSLVGFDSQVSLRPPGALTSSGNAVAQDVPDQEEAGEEDEAEQANSSLDPLADGQHHQVQRETQALASHQVRVLRLRLLHPVCSSCLFLSVFT